MPEPTDVELWRGVEHTVREVLLPALDSLGDEWARAAAIQLAGLARYARERPVGDRSEREAAELVGLLDRLTTNAIVARHLPPDDAAAGGVLAAVGAILADAVDDDGDAGDEVRAVLRPLVVRQLDDQLAVTSPLISAFRGQPDA